MTLFLKEKIMEEMRIAEGYRLSILLVEDWRKAHSELIRVNEFGENEKSADYLEDLRVEYERHNQQVRKYYCEHLLTNHSF